jgi:hypothetical protein
MQSSSRDPMVDRLGSEAEAKQLPPRDHIVLAPDKRPERSLYV